MDWTLEVVVVPVSDIDASIEFYRDRVGFGLDHDTDTPNGRVVQLTPPGSGCSIVMGTFPPMQRMPPGSLHGLQLVVADARSRSVRTFAQGLIIDLMFALAAIIGTLTHFDPFDKIAWATLGILLAKTMIQTIAAYIMRIKVTPTARITGRPPAERVELATLAVPTPAYNERNR